MTPAVGGSKAATLGGGQSATKVEFSHSTK